MKNTIIKYAREEVDEYIVSDYFSKNIQIGDFSIYSDFITTFKLETNDKLERVSYVLYGTADYWDILLMLNNRDPLFQMTYDYDLIDRASIKYAQLYSETYSNGPLNEEDFNSMKDKRDVELEELNEQYRKIYVVKPQRINEFILLLKSQGII